MTETHNYFCNNLPCFPKPGNTGRVTAFGRSHGLLEKHSVSAAWIVLGCFATLTLLPIKKTIIRMSIVIFFSIILLIAQNATACAVFAFVIFLVEYNGHSLLKRFISKRILLLLLTIIFGLGTVWLILLVLPESVGFRMFSISFINLHVKRKCAKAAIPQNEWIADSANIDRQKLKRGFLL